jgi:Fic family protein
MNEDLTRQLIERIDILVSLNIPPYSEGKYPVKGIANDLLKLCDAENTAQDMVKKTGKTRNQIDVNLTKLRNKGLIRSVTKDKKTYYVRLK